LTHEFNRLNTINDKQRTALRDELQFILSSPEGVFTTSEKALEYKRVSAELKSFPCVTSADAVKSLNLARQPTKEKKPPVNYTRKRKDNPSADSVAGILEKETELCHSGGSDEEHSDFDL
jgi:hypothetical protein